MSIKKLLCAAVLGAVLAGTAGCAGMGRNPVDPFEPMNREVTKFNEAIDRALLKPVATAYREQVPPLVRTGVANFFGNLGDLWSAANSALQLKIPDAMENLMRFHVNTFFGLGGILDLASEFNIERHKEDFGQTLGRYGVPAGPYIVLPFLGPSTLRDSLAFTVDRRGDLVRNVNDRDLRYSLYTLRVVDQRANLLRVGEVLTAASLDKYSFTRDAFLQKRRAEIRGNKEDPDAGQMPQTGEDAAPAPGQPASAPKR
jgi:phospholipid-binding lipoprotein MlaA